MLYDTNTFKSKVVLIFRVDHINVKMLFFTNNSDNCSERERK